MTRFILAATLAAGAMAATVAAADPYVDYTPMKGVWEVQTIKVDPNHIDDYLTGLKKNFIPILETEKRHGVIDQYMILQKLNGNAGANIQIVQHYPSAAMLDPDQTRDQAIDKEIKARFSKEQSDKIIQGYDKYRSFEADEMWTQVDMSK
jgi:opacity protein-like surface antigen